MTPPQTPGARAFLLCSGEIPANLQLCKAAGPGRVRCGASLGSPPPPHPPGPSPGRGLALQVGREQSLPQELEEGTPGVGRHGVLPHPIANWHLQFAQGLVLGAEGPAPPPPLVLS